MERISWSDGLLLCPEHLALQDDLLRQYSRRLWENLVPCPWGVVESTLDRDAFSRGFLRWNRLFCISPQGEILDQGPGVGQLEPGSLDFPEESFSVWVWPTERWHEREVPVATGRRVPVHSREWSQGFAVPEGVVDALCVSRFRLRGGRMELDERFYPSALLVGRSPHWQALLEKLQDACRKGGGENLDIQAFSALLPALGFESPFRLYIEMVRLCVLIGVAELAPVPFSHKDCSSWVTPLLALIARQGENRTGASIRKIPLHRAGQHLYTASIQAEDWNVPGVRLLWKRKVPFLGDEHSILRLASLSQIPKLVRAALPGIVVTPVGDASRDGLDYCLILSIKQADGLWTECLRAGSVALHCAQVGDADQFFLTEESP